MLSNPNINQQENYWNRLAAAAICTHPLRLETIENFITPKMSILDYGCGYGRICQQLWGKGYTDILGVDISPAMIEKGKRLFPSLRLMVLDEKTFWDESQYFDLVILFSVLTCIPENEALSDLIRLIHKVLVDGGYLYISDTLIQTNRRNRQRYEQFCREYGTYGVIRLPDGGIFRHFELKDIQDEYIFNALNEIKNLDDEIRAKNEELSDYLKGQDFQGAGIPVEMGQAAVINRGLAQQHPDRVRSLVEKRPALAAIAQGREALETALGRRED